MATTLREIHKLYLLLRDCLPEAEELYLIDEIDKMVDRMNGEETLIRAIKIMYPKKKINRNNPVELLMLFVRGMKDTDFFQYAAFINGIKRGK